MLGLGGGIAPTVYQKKAITTRRMPDLAVVQTESSDGEKWCNLDNW